MHQISPKLEQDHPAGVQVLGRVAVSCSPAQHTHSSTTATRHRKLKMEGATELYVKKLSRSFFDMIRATATEFRLLFDAPTQSAYLVWAEAEVEVFCQTFARQVLQSSTTPIATTAECMHTVVTYARGLTDAGLDLEFVLWKVLSPRLNEELDLAGKTWMGHVALHLLDETWQRQKFGGLMARQFTEQMKRCGVQQPDDYLEQRECVLFEATVVFCSTSFDFLASCSRLYHPTTRECILSHVCKLFSVFMTKLCQAFNESSLFQTNVTFVWDVILDNARRVLQKVHGCPVPQLEDLAVSLQRMWEDASSDSDVSHF
eukprot:m.253795 g.253795  ORF g.253795 m.253795 type:complete len:316 (+) comp22675_c0_seq26:1937-2884(+)